MRMKVRVRVSEDEDAGVRVRARVSLSCGSILTSNRETLFRHFYFRYFSVLHLILSTFV